MKKMIARLLAQKERFTTGAAVLSITTFLSYLMGLMRDRLFAHTFGASRELDLYNASFIIPDLLLNILVSSALSAAFIPVFTGLFTQGKKEEALRLANTILHAAVFVIFLLGGIAAIFMPQLAALIAPGFSEAETATLIRLSRLMMISPLLMAVSSTFGAMLVSFKAFLPYGLSAIFYNIGIIGGIFLTPWLGLYGLIVGTLIGAFLHLLPRLVAIRASWYVYTSAISLRDTNFLKVIKLSLPKMIGHPVEQLTFLAFTRIASLLAAGSVTAVSFARNFQSVPVALFGIAFSVAIYPTLAEAAAKSDRSLFLKSFWKAFRDISVITVCSALGLYFLSDLPIRIFLGGGKFSDENILRTAKVLSVFALSIPTESLIHLLARSFYALKNTIIPVLLSILGLVISITFASTHMKTSGILAIPYGFFLGSATEVVLLGLLLRARIRTITASPKSSPSGPS